ncbi:hypothetical protein C5167_019741 [Papaver somniferum]|uniref:Uncharacterized protein n=1 Tax=Papaver somniferum TaxID=3469 RepID=A0A4Y7IV94_PAPSO|nr:hypothetical protein C5167_019741 [Papaver somniferum]
MAAKSKSQFLSAIKTPNFPFSSHDSTNQLAPNLKGGNIPGELFVSKIRIQKSSNQSQYYPQFLCDCCWDCEDGGEWMKMNFDKKKGTCYV